MHRLVLTLAIVLALAAPASAQAAFEVRSFTFTPGSLKAGSHPDVQLALEFAPYNAGSPPEHVRDLTISLPPGVVGNPTATARCTAAAFAADGCPASSRVGTTSVRTTIPALIGSSVTAAGDVYNLVPGAREPARLGVVVRPPLGAEKVFIVSRVALRASDGGLDSIITGLPSQIGVPLLGDVDMWIESMSLTLLGRPPGAAKPFLTMPTGCRPAVARVTARSASGTAASRAAPAFTPTGCAQLPFRPSLAATISKGPQPALHTVITGPRDNANTASAAVTLPRGIVVNTAALQNVCTLAQQAAGPCPDAARVGRAVARSPLLPPLTGPVFLASIPGQVLPGVRVDLSGVVSLSLLGQAGGNPLRTAFTGIPDVPLERFELSFDAGKALGATTDVCRGPLPRISADLTGHNGKTVALRVPMTVSGCTKPRASLRVRGRLLRLHVVAARGGPALQRVRLTLPRRLKAHPRRGWISPGARLSRRGVVTVEARGARRITATLRRGAFTGRLGKRRSFVLRTLDASGRSVRQKIRAKH